MAMQWGPGRIKGHGSTNGQAGGVLTERGDYWDAISGVWLKSHPQALWRQHSDAVNSRLFGRWLDPGAIGRVLKTDLFDEAFGGGLYPMLASRATHVVGLDLSAVTARAAQCHHSGLSGLAADVRHLPYADGAFDVIVSNSTLDHFTSLDDVVVSLGELWRVLRPGGRLLLTLDNLANPVIALRNSLPIRLLNRLGIVPYYVGATCGPKGLKRMLAQTGFEVLEMSAVLHHPSVIAVAAARALQRRAAPATRQRFLALLGAFERLGDWPTRFLTGHYVAVKALRR